MANKTNSSKTKRLFGNMSGAIRKMLNTILGVVAIYIVIAILNAFGLVSSAMDNILPQLCIYSIVAIALNLCVGFLGDLSLGHAGFMAVGAFVSASFTLATQDVIPSPLVRFILSMIVGVLCAALAGFLIGIPVLRLNGDYLAIVTLAFGEIIKGLLNVTFIGKDQTGFHFAFINDDIELDATGTMIIDGAKGILHIPRVTNFTIGIIMLVITLLVSQFLVTSRTGRAIQAIRDNRIAAESVGVRVTKYKMIGFTISAGLAGVAGVLYAHNLPTITANKFDFNMSILVLVFVVLGGLGNFRGSIIAATLLTLLPELLRGLSDYRMLIYSVLLIGIMIFNWAPGVKDWKDKQFMKLKKKFAKTVKTGKEA